MAAIFTPGLRVSERDIVLKDRRLPLEGEVLVEVGARVSATDVVARTDLPGKIYPANVANQLGVDSGRLKQFMLKDIGDSVVEDEIIAKTPGFFGLFISEAKAISSGTIESISTVTGQVIIQAHPIPVEVDAYIAGTVVEVIPGEGCLVQSAAALVQGIFGLGGEVRGPLRMVARARTSILVASDITADMKDHIIVGGAHIGLDALQKAVDVGVAGIVTGGFDYDDIKELLGYEVGVAITGGEDLGLTLVVTEGFGGIDMAPATFELLRRKEGAQASINGATQIRAGVIRPEVIVTFDEQGSSEKYVPPEPEGIALGDTVRGIRAPYFGRIGKVSGLPVDLKTMESETRVRVLEVEFDDGSVVQMPRANVESIEE
jgi:hypothetical protein